MFRLLGVESNLRAHVNHDPGTHNYGLDNRQAFYRMIGDHFFRAPVVTAQRGTVAASLMPDLDVLAAAPDETVATITAGWYTGPEGAPRHREEEGRRGDDC